MLHSPSKTACRRGPDSVHHIFYFSAILRIDIFCRLTIITLRQHTCRFQQEKQMNRSHPIPSRDITLPDTVRTALIRNRSTQVCFKTRVAGVQPGAKPQGPQDGVKRGVRAGGSRVGSPRPVDHQWRERSPGLLVACCWCLFSGLRSLRDLLKAGGRAQNMLADRIGRGGQDGAAVSLDAFFGGCRNDVRAARNGQTQQNRELGQLCQTQKWLKRYKIGMFANLAMLANTFSQNRPAADLTLLPV